MKNNILNECELTILMPCLNEAETLEICIKKALGFLNENNIEGEVLIADNGSNDGSQEIATRCGARVVDIEEKGYGSALIGGTKAAMGKYIIMGDADDSYDFINLMPFVDKLRQGYELVMGNRFKGGIADGAMPPLHKYIGNPVLSFIGRLFYKSDIKDFHCGLRGYNKESILKLNLKTTGMEYASEMVVQSTLNKLKLTEVPTTLAKDGRSRAPHLRSFRDGWRHLRFLLMYSPKWLFFYPGITFFLIGLISMVMLSNGVVKIKNISFDIHTMIYAAAFMIVGLQVTLISVFTNVYAVNSKFIPSNDKTINKVKKFTVEKGLISGLVIFIVGLIASIFAISIWSENSFGDLQPEKIMRITIPAIVAIISGIQIIFSSFFLGILNIQHK